MATAFPRSLRTLETDGMHGSILGLLLAATLLGVWVARAFYARLAVYVVTETARLEVDRAVHTVEALVSGRVRERTQLEGELWRGLMEVGRELGLCGKYAAD